jgi:transcriptional regulator with XRE-family HTH domain
VYGYGFTFMKTTGKDLKPNPDAVRKAVGANVKAYRKAAGLSQMDLAREAYLELSTVHRIEAAKTDTSISTLARIRRVLKVSWKNLLNGV